MAAWRRLVIRRLGEVTYWVIESPSELREYLDVNVRKEWESDLRDERKDPDRSRWLRSLERRNWCVEVVGMAKIKLNNELMNFEDSRTGYNFARRLNERKEGLRKDIEKYGRVIPPLILRADDYQLMDGYCRYSTLKDMGVKRVLAYVGYLP